MISFADAGSVRSCAALAAFEGAGGNNPATCTSFGLAASLAILYAIGSAALTRFSIVACALAILTGAAGFAGAAGVLDATLAVTAGAASSSSSSWARSKSLAKGLAGGRSLLANTVSILTPALRAASSDRSDGMAPRFLISASATA